MKIQRYLVPVFISIAVYCISNFRLEIPTELRGWVMITIFTPIVNMLINSQTLIDGFKNCFCYYHTWDSEITPDIVSWLQHYMLNHVRWSQETISETAKGKHVFWWDTQEISMKPQAREIPTGWCCISYNNGMLFVNAPFPSSSIYQQRKNIKQKITLYSLTKVDWGKLIEHVRDYYFKEVSEKRMIVYSSRSRWNWWEQQCIDIRPNVDRSWCFGNAKKECCWDVVEKFFTKETKQLYKKLNKPYNCAFLISGPPGTGKSELLFLIASFLWERLQRPVYILNPAGLDDDGLQIMLNEITSGFVLVDEWDMGIKLSRKEKKRLEKKDKDGEDSDDEIFSTHTTYPSVTAWHNALDKCNNEIIWWFTTNNRDRLGKINHGSLVRKGRIDYEFVFDQITVDELNLIVQKLAPGMEIELNDGMTIAEVINQILISA